MLKVPVRERRLVDLVVGAVAAIKIDSEGALRTLGRDHPSLVVEIQQERADELEHISKMVSHFGYTSILS